MVALYRLLATLGGPLIRLHLARRRRQGREDSERWRERLGLPGRSRPAGRLVWIHAASVGESLSVLPLVERLGRDHPAWSVLLTTGTVTSARLMGERLPEGARHQYVPVDRPAYVRRFLDHWRPDLVLWTESEFWPGTLTEVAARRLPLILINGRVSPRSFARWRRLSGVIRRLLSGFALCLGQTPGDAERLAALGAPRALCRGNLKFAVPPLPADEAELARLAERMGARPRWLAASTHAGEEDIAARVHRTLEQDFPALLTVIVPRHPPRGEEIAAGLTAAGFRVARRATGEEIAPHTQIYLADTLGELGLFFRLCPLAFMGKSLVPLGGQNPLEPARLDCAVLFGPHMTNFADMTRRMLETGAAREVADEAALSGTVARLLRHPEECSRLAAGARVFASEEAGALDAVMSEIAPFLRSAGMEPG